MKTLIGSPPSGVKFGVGAVENFLFFDVVKYRKMNLLLALQTLYRMSCFTGNGKLNKVLLNAQKKVQAFEGVVSVRESIFIMNHIKEALNFLEGNQAYSGSPIWGVLDVQVNDEFDLSESCSLLHQLKCSKVQYAKNEIEICMLNFLQNYHYRLCKTYQGEDSSAKFKAQYFGVIHAYKGFVNANN